MPSSSVTTLNGEVISVSHTADRCRITIELKGTLAVTAGLMKQTVVRMGVVEGAAIAAQISPSSVLIGVPAA